MRVRACVPEEGRCQSWDRTGSESWRQGEGCEDALAGDEGFSCSEQRPAIGSHVIRSKSTLNPVYLLFQSDMYAFLITLLSFLI